MLCMFLSFVSCKQEVDKNDLYVLEPSEEYLEYEIDSDTEVPQFNLYTFEDKGIEYLTFSNPHARTILIYELCSGKFIKKITFDYEGPNGIGSWLFGYMVKDFEHIYVPSANRAELFLTDTTGLLKKKYDYSRTLDGINTVKAYYTNMDNTQLTFIGDSLFIPQMLNNRFGDRMVEESVTGIYLDMLDGKVSQFPMNYPHLISSKDVRNTIEGALTFSQVYDGENFVYSFAMDENLYKVDPRTGSIKKFLVRSKYLPDLRFKKMPDDFSQVLKKTCETADYGNIMYDEYRKVYYRFAYPETDLENGLNFLKILHSGKKEFSIIILDEEFNILGETKFPPFTYVPHICFINEDGLFLCTSHFMREDYSDDWLKFQRINLVRNEN